jgi:hypothetical protein
VLIRTDKDIWGVFHVLLYELVVLVVANASTYIVVHISMVSWSDTIIHERSSRVALSYLHVVQLLQLAS